jgi:hypothetical protein
VESFEVRTHTICGAPLANWISTGTSTENVLPTAVCSTSREPQRGCGSFDLCSLR